MVTTLGPASIPLTFIVTAAGFLLILVPAELSAMMPDRTGGAPSYAYPAYSRSGTVERLIAAEATGSLGADDAAELREAFATVSQIRLEHHAGCLAAGRPADNRVDPLALPPLRRAGLRDALRAAQGAQRRLSVFAPLGI